VPSTTAALASLKFFPIFAILPPLINTSVFSKTPSFSLVQTVAFLISIVSCLGNTSLPYPTKGNVIFAFVLRELSDGLLNSFFASATASAPI